MRCLTALAVRHDKFWFWGGKGGGEAAALFVPLKICHSE